MPRGKKPKQSSASNEFAIALEHFKKGFELLIAATEAKRQPAQPAQKARGGKQSRPVKGEPAYALYQLLETSKRPVKVEVLVKKLKRSVQSIRSYLGKYKCFENVSGKGYKVK